VEASTGSTTLLVTGLNFTETVFVDPNGGNTVYVRRPVAGKPTLVERDIRTGAEKPVFAFASADSFALSKDLQTLYRREALPGESGSLAPGIVLIARNLATGTDRELMRRQFGTIYLSPDGRSIATTSNDGAARTRSVLIVTTAGGDPRQIMTTPLRTGPKGTVLASGLAFVAWAPDSQSVLLSKVTTAAGIAGDDAAEFWWAPVDGRAPQKVLEVKTPSDGQAPGPVSVNPDGRVVMEMRQSEPGKPAEVWVLDKVLPTRK
jgi:hypothetical protein